MPVRLVYYCIVTAENLHMAPRLLLGLIASTLTLAANAQFVVLDPNTAPQVVQSVGPAVVRINNSVMVPVQGGLPVSDSIRAPYLKDTLRKIVPPGWNAYVDRNLNVTVPVDYVPASDWKESLRSLANRYNLVFKVDNDGKKIFVDAGPGGMRDLQADNRNLTTGSTLVVERQPVYQMPDGRLRFEVRNGQRLSESIRQFLAAGNWNLVWEAGSDIVLPRGFVSAGTDIKAIMDDVLPNFRMHAVIHRGNNTVVIMSNTAISE